MEAPDEDEQLKAVALLNASTILKARQRAEQELLETHRALELKTEELALSLAVLEATLDSATDGILVTDENLHVAAMNQQFRLMWPKSASASHAHHHNELVRLMAAEFSDPQAFVARIDDIYRDMPPDTFDLLTRSDGQMIERQSRPQLIGGRVVGRVWSFRDITERRNAEQALRDESRVLEILYRVGGDFAANLDLPSLVQSVTDAATQVSGAKFGSFFYNVTDDNGESFLLYTLSGAPPEAFEEFGQPLATALFGPTFRGQPPIRSDDILQDPTYGQWAAHRGMPAGLLPVRSYLAVPVISRSGNVIGGLFFGHPDPGVFDARSEKIVVGIAAQAAVAIDNARMYEAAQRAAEERNLLLESERNARNLAERMGAMKDEFLATLSHELRTPMGAIMGWTQILRRGARTPEELEKGLNTIERNTRQQVQLIDDLLDMNRITSGKVRLDIQPVTPVLFIEAALENVRPAAEGKGVRIQRVLDPSVGAIPGDPSRLQQVMSNLLSNAIKFTPRGGQVQVSLERVNSHVEITVADNGIGIKPEFVEHVFERFRQADASTSRKYGGLGLGLSIVKSLVELHGGSVRVKSLGDGLGASFCVHLPVPLAKEYQAEHQRQHPNAPARQVAPVLSLDLSGLKILVVDDDADGRELVHRLLTENGAEVLVAGGAAEAISILHAHRPDLMVSDIGMPDIDGYELLRRIRSLPAERDRRMPAIALTAFARSEDRMQALRAGFIAHLTKPVESSEFLATVASVAGRTG